MTQLIIHSLHLWIAHHLADSLREKSPDLEVTIIAEKTWNYELRYSSRSSRSELQHLLSSISPLCPRKRSSLSIDANSFHLYLGTPRRLDEFSIRIKSDSDKLLDHLSKEFESRLHFERSAGAPTKSVLKYGGASPFIRELLSWIIWRHYGVSLITEKVWGDDANDIHLLIQDPALRGEAFRYSLPVKIYLDEEVSRDISEEIDHRSDVMGSLIAAGYQPNVEYLSPQDWPQSALRYGFVIDIGERTFDPIEANYLVGAISEGLNQDGVKLHSHPITFQSFIGGEEPRPDHELRVYLPINHWRRDLLIPIGGEQPRRWQVDVYLDDLLTGLPILQSLKSFGFTRVNGQSLHSTDNDLDGGVYVSWGSAINFPKVQQMVIKSLEALGEVPALLQASKTGTAALPISHPLDHTEVVQDNLIELVIFTQDFEADHWRSKLLELCKDQRLTIITEADIEGDDSKTYRLLSLFPWREISFINSPHYLEDRHRQVLELIGTTQEQEDTYPIDLEESWDSEDSDWDHSELQEWLMSSLYEEIDEEIIPVNITYGSSPALLIQWLEDEVGLIFKHEVMTSPHLAEDDPELIIHIPSHYLSLDRFTPLPNSSSSSSEDGQLRLTRTKSLLDPPRQPLLNSDSSALTFSPTQLSDIYGYHDTPEGELILRYREIELTINSLSPPFTDEVTPPQNGAHLKTESMRGILTHPAFVQLCDYLMNAIIRRQTQLISSCPGIGVKRALRWLSVITQTPIISPHSYAETLPWLERLTQSNLPLILIEDFDRLTTHIQALIKRATLNIHIGDQERGPVMIGSLSDGYLTESHQPISDYLSKQMTHGFEYEGFPVSVIPRWSASQVSDALQHLLISLRGDSQKNGSNNQRHLSPTLHSYIDLLRRGELYLLTDEISGHHTDQNISHSMGYHLIDHLARLEESGELKDFKDLRLKLDLLYSKSLSRSILNRLIARLSDALY